jgi:hypothetical protein
LLGGVPSLGGVREVNGINTSIVVGLPIKIRAVSLLRTSQKREESTTWEIRLVGW